MTRGAVLDAVAIWFLSGLLIVVAVLFAATTDGSVAQPAEAVLYGVLGALAALVGRVVGLGGAA